MTTQNGSELGYQQTEVGLIPEDWRCIQIGEISGTITTGRLDANAMRPEGEYPFFTCAREVYRIDKYAFNADALLVSGNGANVGYVHHYHGKFNAYQRTYVLKDFSVETQYLRAQLQSRIKERVRTEVNAGNTPYILKGTLSGMYIPVPADRREQCAIAEALSDADALIEWLERLIAKKRLIKQGAMQDLLTAKRRLPGFSAEWITKPLSSVSAFITKGATPTTYGFDWEAHGILFLRSECVSPRGLDLSQSMFISEEAHRATKRSEVAGGDILITITGNVGRVVRLPDGFGQANINQHIARIRISADEVDPEFVFHQLSRPEYIKHFNSIVTGQAYPQISLQQVRDATVDFPEIAEQTAIASILTDMDAEIQALETRLGKVRQVKEGMMQNLLTGRMRLV